jgi:sulfhydrogenase subunit alpha
MEAINNDIYIKVPYVTRIEGHGHIVVDWENGELKKAVFNIVEAPRFFEAMLKNRSFEEIHVITSRICGICSLGHQVASLKATESALGIEISEQTKLLRKLLVDGATLQSNILHAVFLAMPDFLGAMSAFALIPSHPEVVKTALRAKKLANDIGDIIGGRAVHPITLIPGGFTKVPTIDTLKSIKKSYEDGRNDLTVLVDLYASLVGKIPAFERDTEYIALSSNEEYALYDGDINSTDTDRAPVEKYLDFTKEKIVAHSSAKHCNHARASYMVGALSRYKLNHKQLHPKAIEAAKKLKLDAKTTNTYHNNTAQMVEAVHALEDAILVCDKLINLKPNPNEPIGKPTKFGSGVGATEVPRGVLYHDYTYNNRRQIVNANCIIPTNQNMANLDLDMQKMVPEYIKQGMSKNDLRQHLEMLVRAYDPCVSCSVHMLEVEYI